jgi:hypothetical protein
MLQELLVINIVGCGVAVVGVLLCISWSRAVRWIWPNRKKMFVL